MKNFYVFYGKDRIKSDKNGLDLGFIKNEVDKLIKKINTSDIVYYDFNNTSLSDIVNDAATVSMFSTKKVIVVENASFLMAGGNVDGIDELERYINNPNLNSYLIFISLTEKIDTRKKIVKLLEKNGVVEEFNKIDENYTVNYIRDYLRENDYKMEDIKYFKMNVSDNLYDIKNELDKLMMYKMNDKSISNKDIDAISIKTMDEEIFVLTDSIIKKDITNSFNLLEEFLDKSYDEFHIIMLLASQFRFLFQVKRLYNKNKSDSEIAKILGVNPYRVKFSLKKIYSYSEAMILDYIKKLAKMDHDIKLGLMDKKLALELFILTNE